MKTIAILGNKENISLFRTLGFDMVPVSSKKEALEKLKGLCDSGDYALVLITDRWEKKLGADLDDFKYQPSPAFCSIPVEAGSKEGYLSDVMERAIGSDINVE